MCDRKWEMDAEGREGEGGIRGRESSMALEHAHFSRLNRAGQTTILRYYFTYLILPLVLFTDTSLNIVIYITQQAKVQQIYLQYIFTVY